MIFKGDIGTTIEIDTGQTISTAIGFQIKYRKPNRSTGIWNGTLSGTTKIAYTTIDGDIDEEGKWEIQGFVTFSAAQKYHTTVGSMSVSDTLYP
jgi:hypothetical protein